MASASTRPKPYRWLTEKWTYIKSNQVSHEAMSNLKRVIVLVILSKASVFLNTSILVLEEECNVPLCPTALVFQSSAFRWAGLDVFTRRCCTSLHVSKRLQRTKTLLVSLGQTERLITFILVSSIWHFTLMITIRLFYSTMFAEMTMFLPDALRDNFSIWRHSDMTDTSKGTHFKCLHFSLCHQIPWKDSNQLWMYHTDNIVCVSKAWNISPLLSAAKNSPWIQSD